jgi:hypothetical protein
MFKNLNINHCRSFISFYQAQFCFQIIKIRLPFPELLTASILPYPMPAIIHRQVPQDFP